MGRFNVQSVRHEREPKRQSGGPRAEWLISKRLIRAAFRPSPILDDTGTPSSTKATGRNRSCGTARIWHGQSTLLA